MIVPAGTASSIATPRAALAAGRAALAAGQPALARAWFDRAARLAPDDPTIVLLNAASSLDDEPERTAACLRALLTDTPALREARAMLIACELRAERIAAARDALADLLAAQAPPRDARFARLAAGVAMVAGAPGWIAVGCDGVARICLPGGGQVAGLTLMIDNERISPTLVKQQDAVWRVRLPRSWRKACLLTAMHGGASLIGSPVDLVARRHVEGIAERTEDGALAGWAWHPADPDTPPRLTIVLHDPAAPRAKRVVVTARDLHPEASDAASASHRHFRLDAASLPGHGTIRVLGQDGRDLAGSPIVLDSGRATRPAAIPRRRPLDIVIPVYRGAADFRACLASLKGQAPPDGRIIVVDDAAPDPALRDAVEAAATRGDIVLLRHSANRGFPAAVNTALRDIQGQGERDVLLLNPDTRLPPRAIARLADAAYASGDIGTVTPMTNDGTIVSYPRPGTATAMPDDAALHRLDAAFQAANAGCRVDLPTGVGFCLYLRHDCLAAVGGMREDVFAQGYGEENDFCLRASHLGWRHVAAGDVFVAHAGGRSFGAVKSHLIARNTRLLNALHPGYDAMIAAFIASDRLAPLRRAVDLHLWRQAASDKGAVVLISHARGGGVARHVEARAANIRASGLRPILLEPVPTSVATSCRLADPTAPDAASPNFALPEAFSKMLATLRGADVRWIELHHLLGQSPEMATLAAELAVPLDVFVHDYAAWCPRVTLVGRGGKYCGEPAQIDECDDCVRDLGGRLDEEIGPAALRARSALWLRTARRVVVACDDVATRLRRQFPFVDPVVVPWEDTAAPPRRTAPDPRTRLPNAKIVVAGGISADKGFDVLLQCGRDAARRDLALEFVLVGHSVDDARLLETGRVFVTGPFAAAEGEELVAAQHADLGFVPSVCPETWCYALSLMWHAGLRVASFDLGAQAERIRRQDGGAVLPLGLPTSRLNDLLLRLATA